MELEWLPSGTMSRIVGFKPPTRITVRFQSATPRDRHREQ
jgi:hypothetical protein